MEIVKSNVSSITPTHYGVAQFVHTLFKGQYKCNLVKKSPIWFQKDLDETWKKVDDIVIYKRLSTDVVDAVAKVRHNLMIKPEFSRMEEIVGIDSKKLEELKNLQRAAERDRVFNKLADVEMKLYNSPFKNGVMKELVSLFYVAE